MRKKLILTAALAGLLILTAAALPASAQPGLDTRPVRLIIDFGYVNLFAYPKWISLGPEIEFRLGRLITFNPEAAVWFRQNAGSSVRVVPGATVNLRFRHFFFGGGASGRVSDWKTMAGGWLVPKVQAGYFTGPGRLTLSLYYLSTAKDVAAALTLGFGIGRRAREPED
ncbi:MAG TPA: hypothetical protein P5119_01235 [Candidatus Aminicenantes bacterium]|nr:hypothetical protein [Candidatus Aminicenantes bacterium]HRY63948.1 hypothetical protein [Candidatus Aminicenantes bacterium]HRZ70861.1 hypothetical protein [Candidatus Aminicenantes bacterium]